VHNPGILHPLPCFKLLIMLLLTADQVWCKCSSISPCRKRPDPVMCIDCETSTGFKQEVPIGVRAGPSASSHLFQEQLLLGHPALMHKARHL
jgi:hypothetical protein